MMGAMHADTIDLHTLLRLNDTDPSAALLMRHTGEVARLRRQLPWIAAEHPTAYTAFQSYHREHVARMMRTKATLVSSIAMPDGALFTGAYQIGQERTLTHAEWQAQPGNDVLAAAGARGPDDEEGPTRWFEMTPLPLMTDWIGRLLLSWPGGRGYTRLVKPGVFGVLAIHPENQLTAAPPDPSTLLLTHEELRAIPRSWWDRLGQWRGIYYIRHTPTGRGYVGSAYGTENIAQRWRAYADTGHGGNRELRGLDPSGFTFSVLELVSPTADPTAVIRLEQSWKVRLSTRVPDGLNAN